MKFEDEIEISGIENKAGEYEWSKVHPPILVPISNEKLSIQGIPEQIGLHYSNYPLMFPLIFPLKFEVFVRNILRQTFKKLLKFQTFNN